MRLAIVLFFVCVTYFVRGQTFLDQEDRISFNISQEYELSVVLNTEVFVEMNTIFVYNQQEKIDYIIMYLIEDEEVIDSLFPGIDYSLGKEFIYNSKKITEIQVRKETENGHTEEMLLIRYKGENGKVLYLNFIAIFGEYERKKIKYKEILKSLIINF